MWILQSEKDTFHTQKGDTGPTPNVPQADLSYLWNSNKALSFLIWPRGLVMKAFPLFFSSLLTWKSAAPPAGLMVLLSGLF